MDADLERDLCWRDSARPIDELLSKPGGVVLLGSPGTGKTTLIKRLARSSALGPETSTDRFPALPWCFPVVVLITLFDQKRDGQNVLAYIQASLKETTGEVLVEVFRRHWSNGECLVLLDGLDEVADIGRRIGCAREAGRFVQALGSNRALITSRIVGYSICRLNVPVRHVYLQPFEKDDIDTFIRQWYVAYDRAVHRGAPKPTEAFRNAESLIPSVPMYMRQPSMRN